MRMFFVRQRRFLLPWMRRSTRLAGLALLLFLLKIGVAAACMTHEWSDPVDGLAVAEQTALAKMELQPDPTDPAKHNPGQCADCQCHHAAATLPTELAVKAPIRALARLPDHGTWRESLPPRRELRPPIV